MPDINLAIGAISDGRAIILTEIDVNKEIIPYN
jgi:hypothetical protein